MRFFIFISVAMLVPSLHAQTTTIDQQNPPQQLFYSFSEGITGQISQTGWDIAIEPQGDYTIRLNEYGGTRAWVKTDDIQDNCTGGALNCRGLQDYTPAPYDTTGMMNGENNWVELHNGYSTWTEGAFNQEKPTVSTDVVSYGWGGYKAFSSDPAHAIIGYRIFVIQLRNGSFWQFFVRKSMAAGYEMGYARLDGLEAHDYTLQRVDFENKLFAYLSISQHQVYNPEPILDHWDVTFLYYPPGKPQGQSNDLPGLLHNPGNTTALFDVAPGECLNVNDGNYQANISTIGTDWSSNDVSCQCLVPVTNRQYVIQRGGGEHFQLSFKAFDQGTNQYQILAFPVATDQLQLHPTIAHETCVDCNDGSIDLLIAGGDCPYTVQWEHGPTNAQLGNLEPGNYAVTVTDASSRTATLNITIEPFQCALTVNTISSSPPLCFKSSDGSIAVEFTGAHQPIQYFWNNIPGAASRTNLPAGEYQVSVLDAKDCRTDTTLVLNQPDSIAISAATIPESCPNCNDGSVVIEISGGTAPYQTNWGDGTTGDSRNMMAPGQYEYTITDTNGCTQTGAVKILEADCDLLIHRPAAKSPSCFGDTNGSISISGIGGTPPYSYSWNTGAETAEIDSLDNGTYWVIIEDQEGCSDSAFFELTDAEPISSQLFEVPPACGLCPPTIIADVQGGTPPYMYSWNTGSEHQQVDVTLAQWYVLTILDVRGCIYTDSIFADPTVGIHNVENIAALTLYPNPTNSYIQFGGTHVPFHQVLVRNTLGQVVAVFHQPAAKERLSVSHLNTGVYLVEVHTRAGTQSLRLQILK